MPSKLKPFKLNTPKSHAKSSAEPTASRKRWQQVAVVKVADGARKRLVILYRPRWRTVFIVGLMLISVASLFAFSGLNLLPRTARGFMVSPDLVNSNAAICTEAVLGAEETKLEPKLNRKWFLIGAEFLEQNRLTIELDFSNLPDKCRISGYKLKYQINNTSLNGEVTATNSTTYAFTTGIENFGVGTYPLTVSLATAEGKVIKTATTAFNVSKPVYVAWTLDWEGYNMSDSYLEQIQQLTNRVQRVPLTHMFNPLYAISTGTLKTRGQYFTNWVKQRQQDYGDDVGLHIHMFYQIAEAAGVTPRTDPTWNSRGTGSDVPLSSYTYEEQKKIIAFGKEILRQQGFKDIDTFRAGGWFVNLDTFKALSELGFAAESSGRTAYNLGNNLPGPWSLSETMQPYYPCRTNQNKNCTKGSNNSFPLLEVPNNGGESYRFTTAQLLGRFNANFNGQPQGTHRVITYLSHPEWFYIDFPKMTDLLNHIDGYLYAADRGPVIYTTIDNIQRVWQVNNF